MGFNGTYDGIASGKHSQFAIEAMAIEIVDFPINSMVIFHRFLCVYQRVTQRKSGKKYGIHRWCGSTR